MTRTMQSAFFLYKVQFNQRFTLYVLSTFQLVFLITKHFNPQIFSIWDFSRQNCLTNSWSQVNWIFWNCMENVTVLLSLLWWYSNYLPIPSTVSGSKLFKRYIRIAWLNSEHQTPTRSFEKLDKNIVLTNCF